MATYSNIIIRRLQAGKASFDAWCHDAEYKEADSTDKAPAPHTKLHIHASTTAHTQPDVQSHCSTFMPRLQHTHTTRCTESLLHIHASTTAHTHNQMYRVTAPHSCLDYITHTQPDVQSHCSILHRQFIIIIQQSK